MKIMTDSPIRFPGLFGDWAITISSKAIDIGNGIYWYGILIALGMLLALWWCMRQRTKYGIRDDDLIDGLLWGIPSAIVGARLYYVLFYLSEFKDHEGHFSWSKAIAIWDGGLAIYGGVIAVVIVAVILCRSRHIKLGAMMDLVVMGLLIGQAIGRWGNFLNREAFGSETTLPWRMQLTTTAGELVEVHPTFLYESLWNLVGLLLIVFVVSKARRFDGENTCFYFLWYGVGRFWIEGLRTDSLYLFNWTIAGQPIRVSQVLSLVLMIAALAVLFYNIRLHPHRPEELYVNQVAAREAAQAEEPAEAPETAEPVRAVPVWDDPLDFVAAPEHPLARQGTVFLADVAKHPAVFPGGNTFTHHIVRRMFEAEGLTPNIAMSTNYLETIKMMVSIGLAWSVLPRTMLDDQVVRLPLQDIQLSRQLGYILHTERTLSNAARAFMRLLDEQAFGNGTPAA